MAYLKALPSVLSKTATYTVSTNDGDNVHVNVDATSGAVTINLYAASGNAGKIITVKKTDSSTNAVTLDGNASETLDGSLTLTLPAQYDAITLVCNGSNWVKQSAVGAGALSMTTAPTALQYVRRNSGNTAYEGAIPTAGTHNLYVPAQGIRPLPTGGAGAIEDATSTNNVAGLPFDPTTSEAAYFWVKMPKSWDEGTITAKFVTFNKAGGTGNFVFSLAGMAASDGDAISTALGTAQQVTDGALTAYYVQISAATSAITLGNTPNAGDYCLFVVKRLPADAADTYASDVYLAGVEITLTTDAENDN